MQWNVEVTTSVIVEAATKPQAIRAAFEELAVMGPQYLEDFCNATATREKEEVEA